MKQLSILISAFKKSNYDMAFVAVSLLLGLYLNWPIVYIGILIFVVWMILKPIRNEILIPATMALVVLIPISQVAKDPDLAEGLGISVYVLIITIFFQLVVELFTNEKKHRVKNK